MQRAGRAKESPVNYRPVVGWGRLPEGWSYVEATSVAIDAKDNVIVFNRGQHPVIVLDREGKFLRSWGEGTFRRAPGVTGGPDGTYWLTDDLRHTIRQFPPEGQAAAHDRGSRQGLDAPGRPAVQSPHAR